jgi:hypothetical protein
MVDSPAFLRIANADFMSLRSKISTRIYLSESTGGSIGVLGYFERSLD